MRTMLSDTILALCRNTLPYEAQVCIEGLIGITIDDKEILLVNINELIQREGFVKKSSNKSQQAQKRKTDSGESDNSSSQDEDSDLHKRNGAKRRKRKRRRSKDGEDSIDKGESEPDNETSAYNSDPEASVDSSLKVVRTDDLESRHDMDPDSRDQNHDEQTDSPNIKSERNIHSDDEDLVFVKEEPHEDPCSYGQSQGASQFAMPGSSQSGDSSQMFNQGDPLALGQLQELALQLSGDNRSMVRKPF